jgi:hypothetical protein
LRLTPTRLVRSAVSIQMSKSNGVRERISIGAARFELRPLKLGKLAEVIDALENMAGKSGGDVIIAAARLVAAGIVDSDVTPETILDLEGTMTELNDAVAAVLRVAGLRMSGEALPQPELASPMFMPPSLPAAATATVS